MCPSLLDAVFLPRLCSTALLGTVAVGTTWDPSKPKIWLEQVGSEKGLGPAHRIVHALQHTRSITALI